MTHTRNRTFIGTGLVMCLAVLLFAGTGGALDRPTVDTRRSECQVNINQEIIQQLPTGGRTADALAGVMPAQATLQFQQNAAGNVTDALILVDGQPLYDFDRVKYKKSACTVSGEIQSIQIGGGFAGRLEFNWSGRPSERVTFKTSRLTYNGNPYRGGERTFFYLPASGQVGGQPRPEDVPVYPITPVEPPVPTDVVFQGPGGVVVPNGTLFDFNMTVLPHGDNHDDHMVMYNNRRLFLCIEGPGQTQARANVLQPDRFRLDKTIAPRPGWEWGPFTCDPTGCKGEGSFYGTPIHAYTSQLPVFSVPNKTVNGRLDIELNRSRVPFQFSARYSF